jgi:GNAT superfamily N-acetyltransferase
MEITQAGISDLDELYANRLEFIMDMRNHEVTISEEFQKNTYDYMRLHMEDGTLAAWIARDQGEIIATVFVSYYQILPVMSNPTGKCGYVLNVFTRQEYRRHGIATQLLNRMLQDASEHNVGKIYLSATDMGKPVYEKLGFEVLTKDMVYKVIQ